MLDVQVARGGEGGVDRGGRGGSEPHTYCEIKHVGGAYPTPPSQDVTLLQHPNFWHTYHMHACLTFACRWLLSWRSIGEAEGGQIPTPLAKLSM